MYHTSNRDLTCLLALLPVGCYREKPVRDSKVSHLWACLTMGQVNFVTGQRWTCSRFSIVSVLWGFASVSPVCSHMPFSSAKPAGCCVQWASLPCLCHSVSPGKLQPLLIFLLHFVAILGWFYCSISLNYFILRFFWSYLDHPMSGWVPNRTGVSVMFTSHGGAAHFPRYFCARAMKSLIVSYPECYD